ncbi:MAG: glycosyltransferase family 4 protein [Gemmatimonadaceae bacterium]|nr:glycosyltransferase family 4 protein [Chitinophagaceae bacterium]
MKIVFISSWYSENMGYAENMFPRTMAGLGHDVHLITSTAQVYYNSPDYKKTYEKLLGPAIVEPVVKTIDGYTLHRLPLQIIEGKLGMEGLTARLTKIQPDIIQAFEIDEPATEEAARFTRSQNAKLFTESHMHKSVFLKSKKKQLRSAVTRFMPANNRLKMINEQTIICYPIAEDVADLAVNFFKISRSKIKIQSLGIDSTMFRLPTAAEKDSRADVRSKLGFDDDDIVCIYTGRFAKDKDPHTLARSINQLSETNPRFKGLFTGNGTQEDIDYISSMKNCLIQPFVRVNELNKYYWASDIGVWPRQESTSQLDAAACGLPLVLSDEISVTERVNGNGYLYREGDSNDMVEKLLRLKEKEKRETLGKIGHNKVINKYSWIAIATERLADYSRSLNN